MLLADLSLQKEAVELLSEYREKPQAIFQRTDVASWKDLNDMFAAAQRHFGSVDVVCPGAGVWEPEWSSFWAPPGGGISRDDPLGGRYASLDINITHPIRVTQLAISHFLAMSPPPSPSNPKSVVLVTSIAGQAATLFWPLYHASKHAVDGFVRCFVGFELTHGVRITGVAPGNVLTRMFTDDPEKLRMIDVEKDRFATPDEVAKVMLSLVKDVELNGRDGEKISIQGGTVLEVLAGGVRDVPTFGNVGPFTNGAAGASVSHLEVLQEHIMQNIGSGWGR